MNSNYLRKNNLDLLRIISCVFVVLIHVSATWIVKMQDRSIEPNFLISFLNSSSKFAVPVFFMLSGYFNILNDKNSDIKAFWKKTFTKIILPCLIFMIFYSFLKIFEGIVLKTEIKITFFEIFSGNLGALWFLYSLIPMYLVTPLVIILKKNISEKHFKYFCIIYFLYSILSGIFSNYSVSWTLGNSADYFGFYLIGSIIDNKRNEKVNSKYKIAIVVIILALLVINSCIIYYYSFINKISYDLSTNFNPINVIISLLIFYLFSNISFKTNLNNFVKLTFPIYLIHPFIISLCKLFLSKIILNYNIYLSFVIVYFIVLLFSVFLSYIYNIL